MYRRHLRAQQAAKELNEQSKSKLVQRLAKIPVVFVAWKLTMETYKLLKSSNKILNTSLTSVEKVADYVTKKAEPLVKKLEPQIKTVDELACRGLENLEDIVPVLLKKPNQLINYTKSIYTEIVESGLQKYEEVKQTTISTAKEVQNIGVQKSSDYFESPSGQLIVMALNTTFDAYEMYLDRLLPPLGDETAEQAFGDRSRLPVFERADVLTERFKERLYKHSLLHLQNMRIRSRLAFEKVYNVHYSKSQHMHVKRC